MGLSSTIWSRHSVSTIRSSVVAKAEPAMMPWALGLKGAPTNTPSLMCLAQRYAPMLIRARVSG